MNGNVQKELAQFAETEVADIVARHFNISHQVVPSLMVELAPFVFNGIQAQMGPSDGIEYMEYLLSQFHYLASSRAISMDKCALELFGIKDNSREWLIELLSKKYDIPRNTVERLLPTLVTFILNFLANKKEEIGIIGVYLLLDKETSQQDKAPRKRWIFPFGHQTTANAPKSLLDILTRRRK